MVITEEIKKIRQRFDKLIAQRELLQRQRDEERRGLESAQERLSTMQKAQVVLQEVAQMTQQNLSGRLSMLVSMALAAVYDDPYRLSVEFVQKRGQTECELMFEKHGQLVEPMLASGGGSKDVASFSARPAFYSLRRKGLPILLLDEPVKFLHGVDLQRRFSEMLTEISRRVQMQIILVSDQDDIVGDKVFDIEKLGR